MGSEPNVKPGAQPLHDRYSRYTHLRTHCTGSGARSCATTKMCSGHQRPAPRAPVGYYWCGPVAQPVGNSPRMCAVTAVGDVLRHMVCWATEGGERVLCLVCVGGWACDRHTRKYVRSCPAEVCRIACVTMACVQVRLAVYCARCFGVCPLVVCVVGGGDECAPRIPGRGWGRIYMV